MSLQMNNARTYLTRSSTQKFEKTFSARTKAFELIFFPYCTKEWGNLSYEFRNIESVKMFKPSILNLSDLEKTRFLQFMILMV